MTCLRPERIRPWSRVKRSNPLRSIGGYFTPDFQHLWSETPICRYCLLDFLSKISSSILLVSMNSISTQYLWHICILVRTSRRLTCTKMRALGLHVPSTCSWDPVEIQACNPGPSKYMSTSLQPVDIRKVEVGWCLEAHQQGGTGVNMLV